MKKSKRLRQNNVAAAESDKTAGKKFLWWPWAAALAALFVAFEIYGPALDGAFVLDDRYLPFFDPRYQALPLSKWIAGLRPMLMLSFWLNYSTSATDPHIYHATNVFFHFLNAGLVALIAARLLEWAGLKDGPAKPSLGAFAGALFLVHPLQTESVAYVASRSEVLSVFFYYAAYCVFLYRRTESITWTRALAILTLFGAAVTTKEHTLTLPLLLLLTDLYWTKGGLRAHRRLYAMLAVAGAAGAVFVWRVLGSADTAGFHVKDLTPATYFFTQWRVVWTYVRLFFLPFGQNVDPDVALSHTPLDHGAILGLAAWLAIAAGAWLYRKRWPLASFGVFVFLLLIAPTSSVVPIQDVLAERRLYLPFIGLAFVCLEFLRRLNLKQRAMIEAPVLIILMVLTYQRSAVWGSPLALWQDAAAKSPHKVRPHFQLAYAYYEQNQCPQAAENYEIASRLAPPDYTLLYDWSQALDCAGRPDEAVARLRDALKIEPSAQAWERIGTIYGKRNRVDEALAALDEAQKIDPKYQVTYVTRGKVYETQRNLAAAAQQYQRAIDLDPSSEAAQIARQALAGLQRR